MAMTLKIMARQRLPHFGRRGRFGAMLAHHPHRLFNHFEIARLCAERRILQTDPNMAAASDRLADQGPDIGADAAIIQGAPGASSSSSAR